MRWLQSRHPFSRLQQRPWPLPSLAAFLLLLLMFLLLRDSVVAGSRGWAGDR